jgi:signal transduction histidine kinase/ActR/RegA family two-component response regulator
VKKVPAQGCSTLIAWTFLPGLPDWFGMLVLGFALVLACFLLVKLYRRTREEYERRVEVERNSRWTNHLQQLTGALSRSTTAAAVIDASVPEFLHALNAAAGAIVVVSEDGAHAELVHSVGYDPPFTVAANTVIARDSPFGRAVWTREVQIVERPRTGDTDARVPTAGGTTALAPLIAGNRVVAVLTVSFRGVRGLTPDEQDFLLTAGRRTAEAIQRAALYEAAQRARAEAEQLRTRANEELRERQRAEEALRESETKYRSLATRTSRLYALSAALSESLTVDAVAKALVRRGKVVAGASAASVAMLVENGAELQVLHAEEYTPQVAEAWHRFPLMPGLCWTAAVQTGKPVFAGSFAEWRAKFPASASLAADGGFASLAALPLMVEEAPVGVLAFHFTAPVSFDAEYQALLVSVAHHCAQAIDRARLYETAQRARLEAEAANRSKDDFLSTVSHELRTPLTAVLGWASMLRKGLPDPARARRAVDAICSNAERQAQLIDELLDVSRIVGGRTVLELRDIDLRDSLRGAVEAVMPLAESKGLEVRLGAHPTVPVTADPRRLEQIFLNLLSNAVKFTPPGGRVTVDAEVTGPQVQVRVTDNGSGIDPEFLPHVFERFRQAETDTSRRVDGLGLGLFIARQLVEAQSGSIRAESGGPGTGATFIVSLQVATGRNAARQPSAEVRPQGSADRAGANLSLKGIRVLIVDDEPDVRELMTAALERFGAAVTSVGSARDALAVLSRRSIDVLLADLAMPGQDGYALIRDVRALPSSRAAVPAAAVTACARDDERQRALAAGFQLHLTKPLQPEQLAQAVSALARAASRPESAEVAPAAATPASNVPSPASNI